MSTRIYYGFKTALSLIQILKRVRQFREEVWRPSAEHLLDRFVESPTSTKSEMWIVWMDLRADIKRRGLRNVSVDTDFSITIFPREKGGFLGVVYTEHEDWYNAWISQKGFCEYGYWDNSDEPEGVSLRAWYIRRKEWGKVLLDIGPGIPSMEGFSINIHDPFGPSPKAWRKKS